MKTGVLKKIAPSLRAKFFENFAPDFAGRSPGLPPPDLDDDTYLVALSHLLLTSRTLPQRLTEALAGIQEIAAAESQDELECALAQAGIKADPEVPLSREDMAVQLWFTTPELVTHFWNRKRLRRLRSFVCYGAVPGIAFGRPDVATLESLRSNLDDWFASHNRGRRAVRLQICELDAEFWFLIRHGDTPTRTPKVEEQRTEILQFRPERDDVVVLSPTEHRLRINARTRAERELYRRQFGLCLRGDEEFFGSGSTYNLDPLRTDCAAVLDPHGIDGIAGVRLCKVGWAPENTLNEVYTRAADDLSRCEPAQGSDGPIPPHGRLTEAEFELRMIGCPRPRTILIRPPNTLKLCRYCDPVTIHLWLRRTGIAR